MADAGAPTVHLSDQFYRDKFQHFVLLIIGFCVAILALIAVGVYLYLQRPKPLTFNTGADWRIQQPVPVDQPYVTTPELFQWVADAMTTVFHYDFINYNDQLKISSKYFTDNGWKVFLNQLNNYANYNTIQSGKLFVNGKPAGAPSIFNQGLLTGRYVWWVEIPITISYAGQAQLADRQLTFRVLVVRVPTDNNLSGMGIDNIILK